MTDPLRPFAAMIRALWLARAEGKGASRSQTATPVQADPPRPRPARSLRAQLQGRVAASSAAGSARMRETFVETVLLWELGEKLALDPDFADLVTTVSDQLAADPGVSERLNDALLRLAAAPKPAR